MSSDIVGPFRIKRGNRTEKIYILTITDICSRFSQVVIIPDIHSTTITEAFEENWILKFGAPQTLTTDLGRQYTSSNFRRLTNKYKINHKFTSVMNPTGNSVSERINKQINELMRIYNFYGSKRIKEVIENRLNLLKHSTIEEVPIMVFKFYTDEMIKKINEKTKRKGQRNMLLANQRRTPYSYQIGDLCFHKTHTLTKQEPRYKGPYKVIEVSKDRNRLLLKNNQVKFWGNIKNIKPLNIKRGDCDHTEVIDL